LRYGCRLRGRHASRSGPALRDTCFYKAGKASAAKSGKIGSDQQFERIDDFQYVRYRHLPPWLRRVLHCAIDFIGDSGHARR
jgi:hypothetical protein